MEISAGGWPISHFSLFTFSCLKYFIENPTKNPTEDHWHWLVGALEADLYPLLSLFLDQGFLCFQASGCSLIQSNSLHHITLRSRSHHLFCLSSQARPTLYKSGTSLWAKCLVANLAIWYLGELGGGWSMSKGQEIFEYCLNASIAWIPYLELSWYLWEFWEQVVLNNTIEK